MKITFLHLKQEGIKYNKSYYQDGDIKPTEDLLFTITLFPLTTYEHNAKDLVN